VASVVVTPCTFTCANLGANTVTVKVTDVNGNFSIGTAIVTVVDNIKPVAICKTATVSVDASGSAIITPGMINNGSYDNCSVTLSVSPATFSCSQIGTKTVVLTATDPSGNFATCTTTVNIVDTVRPVIACPTNVVLYASAGKCSKTALVSI